MSERVLSSGRFGARQWRETFRFLEWLHPVWLILSLVTVAGAVAGTHGLLLFE